MERNVQVTLTEDGIVTGRWESLSDAPDRAAIRDLFKAHAAEALNDFRFFGTLRATISWLPAVIVLTMISYTTAQSFPPSPLEVKLTAPPSTDLTLKSVTAGTVDLTVPITLGIILVLTLILIFFAQRDMEKRQDRRRMAAEAAQKLYIRTLDSSAVQPITYKALVREISKKKLRVPLDPASAALIVFFALLVVGQAAFVLWRAKIFVVPWLVVSL